MRETNRYPRPASPKMSYLSPLGTFVRLVHMHKWADKS
jgi:hypothetical protein